MLTKRVIQELEEIEFSSFNIGIKSKEKNEAKTEELRKELSEEILNKFNAKINNKNPEITIIYEPKKETYEFQIKSIFIYGKYNKNVAGIPQTKWPCRKCRGKGCKRCDYTGRMYQESVEEIISKPILKITKAEKTKFSGAGREDIDAKCLAEREFVIELLNPKKRTLDYDNLTKEINKDKRVQVFGLRPSDKKEVIKIKSQKTDKQYLARVKCKKEIKDQDLNKINSFKGMINQRTPIRVSHRRADMIREREIKNIQAGRINSKEFEMLVSAEHGTYIKELISGDEGRTNPSISKLIENDCKCTELTVKKIIKKEN